MLASSGSDGLSRRLGIGAVVFGAVSCSAGMTVVAVAQAAGTRANLPAMTSADMAMLSQLMQNNVKRCFKPSASWGQNLPPIKITIKLKKDGTLVGTPKPFAPSADPAVAAAETAVVHAALACAPYTNLPARLYDDGWNWMLLSFDVSEAKSD